MKKNIFMLILILFSLQSFSNQIDSINEVQLLSFKVNKLTAKVDSLNSLYEREKILNEKYFEIVEKTNSNLSLNWTPINTFFAVIGIILTIISLATIIMAFGNRNQVNMLLREKEKILDEKLMLKNNDIQLKLNQIDIILKKYFNERKPDSANDKYFMFDMIGELEEIKNFVNQDIKDKRWKNRKNI